MKVSKWLGLGILLVALQGCGAGETDVTDADEFFVPRDLDSVTDDPFDSNRLSIVQIQLSPTQFETLKWEGRSLDVGLSQCPSHDFEYTKFTARVNIDGEVLENVTIRKKGYLGSLSSSKPSFKLDFDDLVEGRTFKTLKRMTLNNNRQDPTHARQCLAYDLYRSVGLAAPRCSLSQVYVNGQDMGVYTHVESIKKPFLERVFNDDSGNLYEAQLSDFGQSLNTKFEKKTNKTENDRSDLQTVADAIEIADDNEFLIRISEVIDLEEFILYWAMDAVVGNWDSATGNSNNYYVYRDVNDGLFHYIPWGLDAAFTGENILKQNSGPLYRSNRIAKRLFAIPATRQQYYDQINTILTNHWDEVALVAEVNRIQELADGDELAYETLKAFIQGGDRDDQTSQREKLLAAIAIDGAGQTDYTLTDEEVVCDYDNTMELSASFESTAGGGIGTLSFLDEEGRSIISNLSLVSGTEGKDGLVHLKDETTDPNTHQLILAGYYWIYAVAHALVVSIEEPFYQVSSTNLHGFSNSLMLFRVEPDESLTLIATGKSGKISFTQSGDGSEPSPIKGSIEATMTYFEE